MSQEDLSAFGFDPGLSRVLERISSRLNASLALKYAKALSEEGFLNLDTIGIYVKLSDFQVCMGMKTT